MYSNASANPPFLPIHPPLPDGREDFCRWVVATSFTKANGMRPVKRFVNRNIVGAVVKQVTLRESMGMGFQGLLVHVVPEEEGRLRVTLDPKNLFVGFPERWDTWNKMPYELTHKVVGSPILFGKEGDYGLHPITPSDPHKWGGSPIWTSWSYKLPATTTSSLPSTTFAAEICIPKHEGKAEIHLMSEVGGFYKFDYSSWGVKFYVDAGKASCSSILATNEGGPEVRGPIYTEGKRVEIQLDTWYRVEFNSSACSVTARDTSAMVFTDSWSAGQQNKNGIPMGAVPQFNMTSPEGKFLFRGLWME